jgi:hypothetical protein
MFVRGFRFMWRITGERLYYAKTIADAARAIREDHPGTLLITIHHLTAGGLSMITIKILSINDAFAACDRELVDILRNLADNIDKYNSGTDGLILDSKGNRCGSITFTGKDKA